MLPFNMSGSSLFRSDPPSMASAFLLVSREDQPKRGDPKNTHPRRPPFVPFSGLVLHSEPTKTGRHVCLTLAGGPGRVRRQ